MPNSTRNKVITLRQKHPSYTLQDIGNEVGISRERVRQILKSEGMHTTAFYATTADIKRGVTR